MVRSGLPKSHKSLLLQSLASSIQINNQMFQNKLPRGMADHEAVARSSTQEAELRLPGVKELLKLGASSKSHQAIIEDKRKSLSMAFNIKQLSLCVEEHLNSEGGFCGSCVGSFLSDDRSDGLEPV